MNIELFTKESLKDYMKKNHIIFPKGASFDNSKGLFIPSKDDLLINLSAEQWKTLKREDDLIEHLTDVLTHESTHYLINKTRVTDRYTEEGEEKVCILMAGEIFSN